MFSRIKVSARQKDWCDRKVECHANSRSGMKDSRCLHFLTDHLLTFLGISGAWASAVDSGACHCFASLLRPRCRYPANSRPEIAIAVAAIDRRSFIDKSIAIFVIRRAFAIIGVIRGQSLASGIRCESVGSPRGLSAHAADLIAIEERKGMAIERCNLGAGVCNAARPDRREAAGQ